MIDRRKFLRIPALGLGLAFAERMFGQNSPKPVRAGVLPPVIVSTWDVGIRANAGAWPLLQKRGSALDSVEAAARVAEEEVSCCIGLGAYPDRDGHVTLDASIMNGNGDCGAVSFLQRVKHPISVARKVMEKTPHVLISGEGAQQFAMQNGFPLEKAELSPDAEKEWKKWLEKSRYRPVMNIENRTSSVDRSQTAPYFFDDGRPNHDTIGILAAGSRGDMAGAVTTSGMAFKMHGRVGDSPIIGAGLFVDNEVGAATSSGVGEEVIRICGTHTVVEQMRVGKTPEQACREAIRRIAKRDPAKAKQIQVGFLALTKNGDVGAFALQKGFTYAVTNSQHPQGKMFEAKSWF